MTVYECDYSKTVKAIGIQCYTQGYEDVLTELWDVVERRKTFNLHMLRAFIDGYFDHQGFRCPGTRKVVYERRMRALSDTVDGMTEAAIRGGYLKTVKKVI